MCMVFNETKPQQKVSVYSNCKVDDMGYLFSTNYTVIRSVIFSVTVGMLEASFS